MILLIQALVPADHGSTVVLCVLVSAVVLRVAHYGQLVYHNLAVSVFDTSCKGISKYVGPKSTTAKARVAVLAPMPLEEEHTSCHMQPGETLVQ